MELDDADIPNSVDEQNVEIQVEEDSQAASNSGDDTSEDAETYGDVIISLGEPQAEQAAPPDPAPKWVRELRQRVREQEREIKQLKAKASPAPDVPKLGPKPKLEDFDYDPEKFEAAFDTWSARKRAADDHNRKAQEAEQASAQAFEVKRQGYRKGLAELPVADAEDAHETVSSVLSATQQGIILHVAADPAKLVYALGKNPTELDRLAGITDYITLAAEIARMEAKVTTTKRPAVQPEKKLSNTGSAAGSGNKALERLRSEADRTGDYTNVLKYKQQLRQK
jgi:alanyl-tRNA synthetase